MKKCTSKYAITVHIILICDCLRRNRSVAFIARMADTASQWLPLSSGPGQWRSHAFWDSFQECSHSLIFTLQLWFFLSYFGRSAFSMGPGEPSGDPAGLGVIIGAPGRISLWGAWWAAGSCLEWVQGFLEPCVLSSLKFSHQNCFLVLQLLGTSRW